MASTEVIPKKVSRSALLREAEFNEMRPLMEKRLARLKAEVDRLLASDLTTYGEETCLKDTKKLLAHNFPETQTYYCYTQKYARR